MILTCGFSNYNLSLFHLMNHAISKAALFLCAGAIIHSLSNEQDIRRMGGLINFLPISFIVMLIASLAIIGFPFLTGFYSKDIIFEVVFNSFGAINIFIYWIISITAFFTTVYSFRLLYFIFLNQNNSFKFYILNIHESSIAISISLLILGVGSIFNGFLFKDLFLGFGNLFLISNIVPVIKNINIFDSEFISTNIKLIPLFMGILGISFFIFLLKIIKKYLIFYTVFGNIVLNFLVNKWYFDYIYNFYINLKIFNFAKIYIYKIIDKGFLEFFGPFGFWRVLTSGNLTILKFQTGFIYHYLFFYGFTLFLFFYIFEIDFFLSFFQILNILNFKTLQNLGFFKKIKYWYFKQRYLFWCVKNYIIIDYLRTMNYFQYRFDLNYWRPLYSIEKDPYDGIATTRAYFLNWEDWSFIATYDMLWLKSLLHFGFIYWPKITFFFIFNCLFFCSFCIIFLFGFFQFQIAKSYYFLVSYIYWDLQYFFNCFDLAQDVWILYVSGIVFLAYIFIFLLYSFWNNIYNKLLFIFLQESLFSIFVQDCILLCINIFFCIIFLFLFLFFTMLLWDLCHQRIFLEYSPSEFYDIMNRPITWRHYCYKYKHLWIYMKRHISVYLWRFSQTANRWKKGVLVLRTSWPWLRYNYLENYLLMEFYKNTNSVFYTYDSLLLCFNWNTWELMSPFRYFYTNSNPYNLFGWRDTFTLFICFWFYFILREYNENDVVDIFADHYFFSWVFFFIFFVKLFQFIFLYFYIILF